MGFKPSPESVEKMRNKLKGLLVGEKNGHSRAVINLTTGERFWTVKEACEKYGVTHSAIIRACKDPNKKCKKCNWKYVHEVR